MYAVRRHNVRRKALSFALNLFLSFFFIRTSALSGRGEAAHHICMFSLGHLEPPLFFTGGGQKVRNLASIFDTTRNKPPAFGNGANLKSKTPCQSNRR